MKINSLIWLLSAILLFNCAVAMPAATVAQTPDWRWFATLSAGPAWQHAGATQTFYLAPDIEKTYTANHSNQDLFDSELYIGLQKRLSSIIEGQLGVAIAATSNANISGHIWEDTSPEFDNYTYSYQVQHSHLAVKGKLLADLGYWLMPWVSGSLGVAMNRAHNFHNTPLLFQAVANQNFMSNTVTTFTYTVGVGLQKSVFKNWQIGIGYEFADLGKSQLNRAKDQTLNSGLALNHLYLSSILFSLTYIA